MDGLDRIFMMCISIGAVVSGISMFFAYTILIETYERTSTILLTILIGLVVFVLSTIAVAMMLAMG